MKPKPQICFILHTCIFAPIHRVTAATFYQLIEIPLLAVPGFWGFRPQGGFLFPRGKRNQKAASPLWAGPQLLPVARGVGQRGVF